MEASIVIPTCNKASYLELTLASLLRQSYPASQYEVIVVDDGSSDRTSEVLEYFAGQQWNFRSIKQRNAGRSAARNAGILATRGKIVIFVDDDCICCRNLVAAHTQRHAGASNKAVIGLCSDIFTRLPIDREQCKRELKKMLCDMRYTFTEHPAVIEAIENIVAALPVTLELITPEDIDKYPEKIELLAITNPDAYVYDAFQRIALQQFSCPWEFFVTRNVSVDRDSLLKAGMFDEGFRGWGEEDPELGYRLFTAGVVFDTTLDAIIYHQAHPRNKEMTLKEWLGNYMKFCEKYDAPELYLKLQFARRLITLPDYEQIVGKIKAGLLGETDLQAIKERYEELIADCLETGLEPA
ncbi:glycosyltransferase [Ktedonosporobacter rubrisoli]|uniref:Glycosyltransferase n=1 Tax=Ktedonosporobacter rubrisoli TaxID=2509675 RepID=A0A4P6JWC2_KTERU|nr:glycosyltransferase family 2 protein [Ktedonosporobacter rubrisoli]QBD79979.1 glycosyltransferase [Ktedonosporobacter rubrisoli]